MSDYRRRDFLKASVAFAAASAAGGLSCVEIASAAPIQVPTIDKLTTGQLQSLGIHRRRPARLQLAVGRLGLRHRGRRVRNQ